MAQDAASAQNTLISTAWMIAFKGVQGECKGAARIKKARQWLGTAESNFASGGRTLEREDCIFEVALRAWKPLVVCIMYCTKFVSTLL